MHIKVVDVRTFITESEVNELENASTNSSVLFSLCVGYNLIVDVFERAIMTKLTNIIREPPPPLHIGCIACKHGHCKILENCNYVNDIL